MKRRRFILSLLGGSALGWTGWKLGSQWTPSQSTCASPHSATGNLVKLSRSAQALGTQVSLTLFHQDPKIAEAAIEHAFQEIELVEQLMSIYRPESQLSQLNKDGILEHPHPYLLEVLQTASELSRKTNGAFDVTIQPLYELYAHHAENKTIPEESAIRQTLKSVDWRKLDISADRIVLRGANSALTLNGIAQGFASDAVTRVLKSHGIEHALVDTGEIETLGTHAEKRDWAIGIKHPRKRGDLMGMVQLHGRCLATSGDYETRFGDGFDNHHLLDPHTGHSANELSSISVAASTAMQADALSTAVFVMGLKKGKELIEATTATDALFVTKQGKVSRTAGFPFTT